MSYSERIRACNNVCFDELSPWFIAGEAYGWAEQKFATHLSAYPEVFITTAAGITLHERLTAYRSRTEQVNAVMYDLHAQGVIDTWVNESYPVTLSFNQQAVMEIERAAASFMGIRSFGVHVNGLVRKANGLHVWVATRSRHKPFWPGKLDQLVAGGQPVGLSLLDNVVKEAVEEADVPEALARQAQAVGTIRYRYQSWRGLENSTLFLYDLWLPEDFVPVNNDGEVAEFVLMSLHEMAELTEHSTAFKDNCNLVNIDLLLRHGIISATHPDYPLLIRALYDKKEAHR